MERNKDGLPKILTLESFKPTPALSFKLNSEILGHLNDCLKANVRPKLVVKDGNFSIKINEKLIFPCLKTPEYSNLDVYSSNFDTNNQYSFNGRISHKLTAVTDSKQIEKINSTKNVKHLKLHPASPKNHSTSTPATPLNFDPYLIINSDTKSDITTKFLYFMALGPSTKDQLIKLLRFKSPMVDGLLSTYCQIYNPNDSFLIDDVFPNNKSVSDSNHYILKDKSYKDLRPWTWKYYSDNERNLIISNINHGLTRLGYLETHPLRKKIVENTSESETINSTATKQFHGGLVSSSKKSSPFKKSQTESPKLVPVSTPNSSTTFNLNNSNTSIRNADTKKRQLSSNSSSSTSDDEVKRFKKEEYTSPSSANDEEEEYDELDRSKTNHYNNLTVKFKQKYQEYTDLYTLLQTNPTGFTPETKKSISKLFELHQALQDWKKQLWNYNNDLKSKEDIKHLTKHKKPTVTPYKSTSSQVDELTSSKKKTVKPVLNY